MYVYYVYPEGSRHKAAKTSRRFKASWIAWKLGMREAWRMYTLRGIPRRIVIERHNTMYGSAY